MSSRYGLEIRAVTSADAPGLLELLQPISPLLTPRALAERLDAIHHEQGTALIAAEWGPPSGLIVMHWYWTLEAPQSTAQITTLLVGPDQRRRGIGRLLVKAAAQAARIAGCGALELLGPTPDQPCLHEFCRASGFAEARCVTRALRKKRMGTAYRNRGGGGPPPAGDAPHLPNERLRSTIAMEPRKSQREDSMQVTSGSATAGKSHTRRRSTRRRSECATAPTARS